MFGADGELTGPVAKNLSESERAGLRAAVGAEPGDCAFFAAGTRADALALLGAARLEIGQRVGLIDESAVVVLLGGRRPDVRGDRGRRRQPGWTAIHHPFTSPHDDWADTFAQDPGRGAGLGLRHRLQRQRDRRRLDPYPPRRDAVRVFAVLGISQDEAQSKFGFLLEAFKYGPPPHGGIAFGWDRICMLLAGRRRCAR